jgi:Zn-dependent oligopeptidase
VRAVVLWGFSARGQNRSAHGTLATIVLQEITFDKQRCHKAVREYILSTKATWAGVPAKRKAAAGAAQRAPAPKRAGTAAPTTTAAATPLSKETQRRQLMREGKQRAKGRKTTDYIFLETLRSSGASAFIMVLTFGCGLIKTIRRTGTWR